MKGNLRINSLNLLVQELLGSLPHFDEDHRREFLSRLKTILTFGNGGLLGLMTHILLLLAVKLYLDRWPPIGFGDNLERPNEENKIIKKKGIK